MKWNKYSNFNVANENIVDVKKYLKEHYVAFPFLRIALNKKKPRYTWQIYIALVVN